MKLTVLIIFGVGFFFSAFSVVNYYGKDGGEDKEFSRKANLALRQVGHELLKLGGDERSAIPPVKITGPGEFTLMLESAFSYDTLPQLLNQALISYDIQRDYEVVVKRCDDYIPILGYNRAAFAEDAVPCVGREQWQGCNNIAVVFSASSASPGGKHGLKFSLFLLIFLIIAGIGFFWKKENTTDGSSSVSGAAMPLGNFSFDHYNQTLRLGDQRQQLTFRESKLLFFLARNANEVIPRETLIAEVWGDEGVIVGRSLDVFISRLRKLLKGDDTVKIKSIHSVGYRLEVAES
ncbi:MAG: winged helix-turn-helix transcriptional regulator [Phaeodactylibacter sp.]|nr:winged helix-turn-helix transcriptional regulator [Phaeodactylibacter sp.]MCB9288132.1 winged helix-turn-helix transcriptional regulator [Lewinellaceae bacterium]